MLPSASWPFAPFARSAQRLSCRVMRSLLTTSAAVVLSACGSSDGPSGTPGSGQSTTLANLSPVSGDTQQALLGTSLTDDIVVVARNPLGLLATGVPLSAIASAGGSVAPATILTDAAGEARFRWALGRVEGEQRLAIATAGGGRPAVFSASGTRLNLILSCGSMPVLGCEFGPEQFATIPATVTPFLIGSIAGLPDEQPPHPVRISRGFALQKT